MAVPLRPVSHFHGRFRINIGMCPTPPSLSFLAVVPIVFTMGVLDGSGALYQRYQWPDDQSEQQSESRRTAGLAGLAIDLQILVSGLYLVLQLRTASRLQDCLLAGCRNAATLAVSERRY